MAPPTAQLTKSKSCQSLRISLPSSHSIPAPHPPSHRSPNVTRAWPLFHLFYCSSDKGLNPPHYPAHNCQSFPCQTDVISLRRKPVVVGGTLNYAAGKLCSSKPSGVTFVLCRPSQTASRVRQLTCLLSVVLLSTVYSRTFLFCRSSGSVHWTLS